MFRLGLGLIHNRGNLGNRSQIQSLLALVVQHFVQFTDPDTGALLVNSDSGEPRGYEWYSLAGVTTEHEVRFYQVVPFGVNPPNNLYDLDSHKVFYAARDEDKVAEHPRFFNWLLKRGTDFGADAAIYVRFPLLFSSIDLDLRLQRIIQNPDRVLLEPTWGKVGTVRLLREVGQVREDLDFDSGLTDLRARIAARGLVSE